MTTSFNFADTFPVIAGLLNERAGSNRFTSHDELVQAMIQSPQGSTLLLAAADHSKLKPQVIASTMIAWFSQQFTIGKNPFRHEFERAKVEGKWAYRCIAPESRTMMTPLDECASDFGEGAKSGPMVRFEDLMAAWDEEVKEEGEATSEPGGQATSQQLRTEEVMLRMSENSLHADDAFASARRDASIRYRNKEDFFAIAAIHGISARTLLAWLEHEDAKWINDPMEGIGTGPGANYQGEWPDLDTEMGRYARMNIPPIRFDDSDFRAAYQTYMEARKGV